MLVGTLSGMPCYARDLAEPTRSRCPMDVATLLRKLRQVAVERAALTSDLRRLGQALIQTTELDEDPDGGPIQQGEHDVRLEGQSRTEEPDRVLAPVLQRGIACSSKLKVEYNRERPQTGLPRPCLMPPVIAACLGEYAWFVARSSLLTVRASWMVPVRASGMALLTTTAAFSHFTRVVASITGATRRWAPAADEAKRNEG
jgi:hypothetical protein